MSTCIAAGDFVTESGLLYILDAFALDTAVEGSESRYGFCKVPLQISIGETLHGWQDWWDTGCPSVRKTMSVGPGGPVIGQVSAACGTVVMAGPLSGSVKSCKAGDISLHHVSNSLNGTIVNSSEKICDSEYVFKQSLYRGNTFYAARDGSQFVSG